MVGNENIGSHQHTRRFIRSVVFTQHGNNQFQPCEAFKTAQWLRCWILSQTNMTNDMDVVPTITTYSTYQVQLILVRLDRWSQSVPYLDGQILVIQPVHLFSSIQSDPSLGWINERSFADLNLR